MYLYHKTLHPKSHTLNTVYILNNIYLLISYIYIWLYHKTLHPKTYTLNTEASLASITRFVCFLVQSFRFEYPARLQLRLRAGERWERGWQRREGRAKRGEGGEGTEGREGRGERGKVRRCVYVHVCVFASPQIRRDACGHSHTRIPCTRIWVAPDWDPAPSSELKSGSIRSPPPGVYEFDASESIRLSITSEREREREGGREERRGEEREKERERERERVCVCVCACEC